MSNLPNVLCHVVLRDGQSLCCYELYNTLASTTLATKQPDRHVPPADTYQPQRHINQPYRSQPQSTRCPPLQRGTVPIFHPPNDIAIRTASYGLPDKTDNVIT
jgi:hypothetical protein